MHCLLFFLVFNFAMPFIIPRLVCAKRPHTRVERVVGIGFQPGLDSGKVRCRMSEIYTMFK